MELKIDFNNPRILEGHLEQAWPQTELGESVKQRTVIGSRGGLSYKLFPISQHPRQVFIISTFFQSERIQDYFNKIKSYITDAESHAKQYAFGLVRTEEDDSDRRKNRIRDIEDRAYWVYADIGIGSENISSVERIQGFLEMIKLGQEKLNEKWLQILRKAEDFPLLSISHT